MKILAIIIISISLLNASNIPRWYKDGQLKEYPEKEYYIGIGEGNTFQDAQNNAHVYIASQLKVSISSTIESSQLSVESNDEQYFKEIFSEKIQSTVNQSLVGVEIVKNKEYKDKFYVFAVLSKKKYANSLMVELDGLLSSIKSYVNNARKDTEMGKIFTGVQNYIDAQEIIPIFYSKKAFYDAISTMPYILVEDYSLGLISSEIGEVISKINIDIISGDRQSVLAGMPLPKPVIFHAFFGSSKRPINNMPVVIRYEDREIADRGVTNDKGILESFFIGHSIDKNNIKIIAKPDFSGLLPVYKKYLNNTSASGTYKIVKTPPIYFAINILDTDGIRLKKVESKIIKNIEKLGHFVSENSQISLNGEVAVVNEKEVEGKSGIQYLVTVELNSFLSVKKNQTKFGTFSAIGKGLSKNNFIDAKKKAYQKIKISRKKLANILVDSDNKLDKELTKYSKENLAKGKMLFSQNKLKQAFDILSQVTHDANQREEAIKIIEIIKIKINEIEEERLMRINEGKRQNLEHELALARISAEMEIEKYKMENQRLNNNVENINVSSSKPSTSSFSISITPCIAAKAEWTKDSVLKQKINQRVSEMSSQEKYDFNLSTVNCIDRHNHSWMEK